MGIPRETFCEGDRFFDFLSPQSEPKFDRVDVLGCVLEKSAKWWVEHIWADRAAQQGLPSGWALPERPCECI